MTLFDGTYARGAVAAEVDDVAWVQAMLDVEAALGGPRINALEIDIREIAEESGEHISPVVPLARLFTGTHEGSTTQDIVDTAMMLIASRAVPLLGADVASASGAAAGMARRHRATTMMAVTLMEPALPISFGLRATGWMAGLQDAWAALESVPLVVQMGGPVGKREHGTAARVATSLGLDAPVLPWHTNRVLPVRLAGALGLIAGVCGKIARDVTLSPHLHEGVAGRGASSAMAHKRNPVAAVSILACAKRTPGLVSTMFAVMEQENERAAGAWQAEWGTLTELFRLSGSAAAWTRDLLEHLDVDAEAMAAEAGPNADLGSAVELIETALSFYGL